MKTLLFAMWRWTETGFSKSGEGIRGMYIGHILNFKAAAEKEFSATRLHS